MKFGSFKEFRASLTSQTMDDVLNYLGIDLAQALKELSVGLTRLVFTENFEAFKVDLVIAAGVELPVRNQLKGAIPSMRLIVRSDTGGQDVVDGTTAWTKDYLYLKNTGASSATITVLFFK